MIFLLSLVAALCFSSVIITLGWRRSVSEAEMARAAGLAMPKKRFDREKYARQTGTGLTFNQIAISFTAWTVGGFILGALLGPLSAFMFGIAGALMYYGSLAELRQTYRMKQAEAIMGAVGTIVSILESTNRDIEFALQKAVDYGSPVGQIIMGDLLERLRAKSSEEGRINEITKWAQRWEHPASDILATLFIASYEKKIRLITMLKNLGETMTGIIEILQRARSQAKGIEWQAKFLALFPPALVLLVSISTPEAGKIYASSPLFLLPVLLGSGASYWLTTNTINNGLSLEASLGVQNQARTDTGKFTKTRFGKLGDQEEVVVPSPEGTKA
jgi:Flp pilus assembly protein TadB